jgi:predicted enzyme related to lactoylglutathione lyase
MAIPQTGRFVWYDLMTTDVPKAAEFFRRLFGWELQEQDMGEFGTYQMIFMGEAAIGGMVALDPSQGIPAHWMAYSTVENVDAACERAIALGGSVKMPAMDIPEVGRFAVIGDPQGGCIAPFTFGGEVPPEPEGMPPQGMFCWSELMSSDPKESQRFYGEIFGWGFGEMDMGEMGTYRVLKRGEVGCGGIMQLPPDAPHPTHWINYVSAENVDEVAAKAEELGAQIFVPPSNIPDVGRFSVLADPTGALFALYCSA